VGVENDPRRLAAAFGKMSVQLFALVVLSATEAVGSLKFH
jgi:hypothetical protein